MDDDLVGIVGAENLFCLAFVEHFELFHGVCEFKFYVVLIFAEIVDGIAEQRLFLLACDIFEEVFLVTLRMPHLAEDLAVTRHQALDGIRRTVGVVRRLGRRMSRVIDILEGHLPVGEQFSGQFFAHDELAFAVADGDRVDVAQAKAREPRGVERRDARRDDLRNMAVDVVAEQRRRILGHHAQAAVRQQAGFDERLETVADAEDQPAAVEQRMDFIVYILIVKYVDDKLGAAVPSPGS